MKIKHLFLTMLLAVGSISMYAQNAYLTVSELISEYYNLGLDIGEASSISYTVRGYVTKWGSGYPTYQNATFYIDDNDTGSTSLLQCFRLTATTETDKRRLNVGDYVEVTAYLQNYNYKAELVNGTFSVLQEAASEYKGETTIANFIAQADTKNIYQLKGVVSDVENNAFGNFKLTDQTGTIYIFGILNSNGESGDFFNMDIENGDTLTLRGIYTLYKGTPEIVNAQYISHIKNSQASQYMGETTIAQFLNYADRENTYQLKGVVSCKYDEYCELLLTDETGSIYIESLTDEDGNTTCNYPDIYKGDTVIVKLSYPEYETYGGCSSDLSVPSATFVSRSIPNKATGTCGGNIIVTLAPATLTLSFTGSGEMDTHIEWDNRTTIKVNDVEKVLFSEGITTITNFGEYHFTCPKVTSISFPQSLTTIADYAFANWQGLQSVAFPEGLTAIRNKAFSGCSNLNNIAIPQNVSSIGLGAFYSCDNLTRFLVVSNNPYYSTNDGILFNKDKSTLCALIAHNAASFEVPNTIKTIQPYAFSNCQKLQNVTMGNNVTTIHGGAFYGCKQLTDLVLSDSLKYIGYDLITETPLYENEKLWDNGALYLNNYLLYTHRDLDWATTYEGIPDEYEIKEGTRVIADFATYYSGEVVKKLTIPSSVEYIGIYGISAQSLEEVIWNATDCHDFVMTDYKGNTHYYGVGNDSYSDIMGAVDYSNLFDNHPILSDPYHAPIRIPLKTDTTTYDTEEVEDYDDSFEPQVKSVTFAANVEHLPSGLCRELKNLESVTAYMPEPITVSDDMFQHVNKQNCVLYVPKGTKSKYQTANVWREFLNIVELESDETVIENMQIDSSGTTPIIVIHEGKFFIMHNGNMYTITGSKVKYNN